ncbi:hypothetical protein RUND412_002150 [Rhizina undulata]
MATIHGVTHAEIDELRLRSTAAKELAYCPYSNFRVGCALLCDDGTIVLGANVENAAYPVGTCAERTALVKAVTEGKKVFKAVAVATDVVSPPASPCGYIGMCRQAIREFADLSVPIFMFNKDGEWVVLTLGELLPMSFGPDSLKH